MFKLNYKLITIKFFLSFFFFLLFSHHIYGVNHIAVNVPSLQANRRVTKRIDNDSNHMHTIPLFYSHVDLTNDPQLQINSLRTLKERFTSCSFSEFLVSFKITNKEDNSSGGGSQISRQPAPHYINFHNITPNNNHDVKVYEFNPNAQNRSGIYVNVSVQQRDGKFWLILQYYTYGYVEEGKKILVTVGFSEKINFQQKNH